MHPIPVILHCMQLLSNEKNARYNRTLLSPLKLNFTFKMNPDGSGVCEMYCLPQYSKGCFNNVQAHIIQYLSLERSYFYCLMKLIECRQDDYKIQDTEAKKCPFLFYILSNLMSKSIVFHKYLYNCKCLIDFIQQFNIYFRHNSQ